MELLVILAALQGLAAAVPRARNGGWKRAALPAVWVALLVPVIGSLDLTPFQVASIVVMAVGAWWLGQRSAAPASKP